MYTISILVDPSSKKSVPSVPPAVLQNLFEEYATAPDSLDAQSLLTLAHAFERTDCFSQALDCAERASKLNPSLKTEAVELARRCIGREQKPT